MKKKIDEEIKENKYIGQIKLIMKVSPLGTDKKAKTTMRTQSKNKTDKTVNEKFHRKKESTIVRLCHVSYRCIL